MPRPLHHGRPGSRVIPTGWAAEHQPVVAATLDCEVTIGPAGGAPVWNPVTRRTETGGLPAVYAGWASVTPIADTDSGVDLADEIASTRLYLIRLDPGHAGVADVEVDHVVHVVTAPAGSRISGRELRVTTIASGGREFSRTVNAVLID